MQRKSLFWQIYPSYVWVVLISLSLILAFAFVSFRALYLQQTVQGLESRASLLQESILSLLLRKEFGEIDSVTKRQAKAANARITVISSEGRVLGDSDPEAESSQAMEQFAEFREALLIGQGMSQRIEARSGEPMIYVALALKDGDKTLGALRVAVPAKFSAREFWTIYLEVLAISTLLVLLVAVMAWFHAQRISRPLEEMRDQADQIARGECSGVAPTSFNVASEIEELGQSINQLAFQLNSRMQMILHQRNEEEAVLSSMVEGVIAVDNAKRIFNLNQSAADLLNINRGFASGRVLEEVVRIPKLQKLVLRVLNGEDPLDEEIVFGETDRVWQVHGNSIRGTEGNNIGALIVFSDVSRMRELESHRRDFVANVSHELRTPLTSIKGFLETLRDGAIHDPQENQRFLEIALKHTDRLNAIIEDLLRLSRLERDTENADIALTQSPVKPVLVEAIQLCEIKRRAKNIQIKLDCPLHLHALISAPLLEQAVVNLIDNAIKFSDDGGTVAVKARQDGAEVIVSVIDRGPGIATEHLSRIFERFYRVDKARSRNLGGTGLGLAIVKHVALAHRGHAEVSSQIGKGSEFSLRLRA